MLTVRHPARMWALAGAGLGLLLAAVGVLALTSSTQQRSDVLAQLERPATPAPQAAPKTAAPAYPAVTVGPGPIHTRMALGPYRVTLGLAPNRASARDGVTLTLSRAGHAVTGAGVALSYSMPSMGMPQVLASTLHERGAGTYSSLDPVLAMPGDWQLRFTVTQPGAAPFIVVVHDHMTR